MRRPSPPRFGARPLCPSASPAPRPLGPPRQPSPRACHYGPALHCIVLSIFPAVVCAYAFVSLSKSFPVSTPTLIPPRPPFSQSAIRPAFPLGPLATACINRRRTLVCALHYIQTG